MGISTRMKTFIHIAAFVLIVACVSDEFCVHVCELSPRCFEVCDCVTASSTTASTTSLVPSTTTTTATSTSSTTSSTTQTTTTTPLETSTTQTNLNGEQVRICYFENWVQWIFPMMNQENIFRQDIEYDPTLCTHIHYGFGAIEDG